MSAKFTKEAYNEINKKLQKSVKVRAIRPFEEYTIEDLKEIVEQYDQIKKALTLPTEEEVCKALGEHLGEKIVYEGFDLQNVDRSRGVCQLNLKTKEIEIYVELPPHLITMIGRFYEGVKK